jgi:hypothetical protein
MKAHLNGKEQARFSWGKRKMCLVSSACMFLVYLVPRDAPGLVRGSFSNNSAMIRPTLLPAGDTSPRLLPL